MKPELVAQIVAAFSPDAGVRIEKLDPKDEVAQAARSIEAIFTAGVHLLRTEVPSERIRSLGSAIWDVFHHRHVVMAMGPPVPTLSFVAMGRTPETLQALVLAPHDWHKTAPTEPIMQLGAIVMVGSQAVDFYNGRFASDGTNLVTRRSKAYEAEFLRVFTNVPMNDYQQGVLRDFPLFDPAFDYVRKAVEPKH